MNSSPTQTPSPTRAGRRARLGFFTLVLVVAALISVVLANVLASRFSARVDVTATGEHRLAPRSLRVVSSLAAPHEVIIAADVAALSARARQDARDVLDRFAAAGSGRFSFRVLDIGSAAGRAEYAGLLAELTAQDQSRLASARGKLEGVVVSCKNLVDDLSGRLGPALTDFLANPGAADAAATTLLARLQVGTARVAGLARDLAVAGAGVPDLLERTIEGVALPAIHQGVARLVDPLASLVSQLVAIEADLRDLSSAVPASAPKVKMLADGTRIRREAADTIHDSILRTPPLDSLLVADALARAATVLVRGPARTDGTPGVRAIAFDALFPSPEVIEASGLASADLRRRAEDAITSALAVLVNPTRPIVVLGYSEPVLTQSKARIFAAIEARLVRSGMDFIEWDLIQSPTPPSLAKLDPSGARPVVYVLRFPETSVKAFGNVASGIDRQRAMARTAADLARSGASLLLSLSPSILPVDKDPDAADEALGLFGFSVRSDRVLLAESRSGGERQVLTDAFVSPPGNEHPLSRVAAGLPTLMPWPIALHLNDSAIASPVTLLELPNSASTWSESQWHGFRGVPRAQRHLVKDPPTFDASPQSRDARDGPWRIAIAGERKGPNSTPQRLVAVGSNEWLVDQVTQMTSGHVDGRMVPTAPGNLEFLEASIYWLARQDELIAQSAAGRVIARVNPMSDTHAAILRAVLMGVLPLCVLVLGLVFRAWQG